MKKYLAIFGIILGVFASIHLSSAEDTKGDVDETLEYTYGSVVSVSPTVVVISEYNYESDQEVQMSYGVNAETKFNNISSLQELAKDDNVDIYYKVLGDQKVAKMITKDETVYDNEENANAEEEDAINDELTNEAMNASNTIPPEENNQMQVNETRG